MAGSKRIAVGGFQHETNTFAPRQATYAEFEAADGWPGLTRGAPLFEAVAGINLPVTGFIDAARTEGHKLVPLTWANAQPSAHVTEEAFERIAGYILEDVEAALAQGPLDAVYLDLHGAMVTTHLQDAEGELLARLRGLIGPAVPLVASLDLHANVTPAMAATADALVIYRTYPHVDMAETGARAARHLARILGGESIPAVCFRQIPFLIPLTAGCTFHDPAKGVYETLAKTEAESGALLSFACGFAPADIHDCGPSVVAYAPRQEQADRAAGALADHIMARESDFAAPIWEAAAGVAEAIRLAARADRPIVLADTQDNPGAGTESDTTGLLAALVGQKAEGAVLAVLKDPDAAAAAHAAGVGATLRLALGEGSGLPGHEPFETEVRVEALGDGRFTGTGPFYRGARMNLGPMALLAIGGVRVVVATRKLQAADQEIFRHLGVEPVEQKILALKSSVHFRADFEPIASQILVVAAPGPNPIDHLQLPYRNLRQGLRLTPLGPAFQAA